MNIDRELDAGTTSRIREGIDRGLYPPVQLQKEAWLLCGGDDLCREYWFTLYRVDHTNMGGTVYRAEAWSSKACTTDTSTGANLHLSVLLLVRANGTARYRVRVLPPGTVVHYDREQDLFDAPGPAWFTL
jgi:hypothetical protein